MLTVSYVFFNVFHWGPLGPIGPISLVIPWLLGFPRITWKRRFPLMLSYEMSWLLKYEISDDLFMTWLSLTSMGNLQCIAETKKLPPSQKSWLRHVDICSQRGSPQSYPWPIFLTENLLKICWLGLVSNSTDPQNQNYPLVNIQFAIEHGNF